MGLDGERRRQAGTPERPSYHRKETTLSILRSLTRYNLLVPVALALGLAPFLPKPHLVEKIQMLSSGQLTRPIDILDLFFHATPALVLLARILVDLVSRTGSKGPGAS